MIGFCCIAVFFTFLWRGILAKETWFCNYSISYTRSPLSALLKISTLPTLLSEMQRQALKITRYTWNSSAALIISLVLRPFAAERKNAYMLFFHSSVSSKLLISLEASVSRECQSGICVSGGTTLMCHLPVSQIKWIFPGQDRISAHFSWSICTGEAS